MRVLIMAKEGNQSEAATPPSAEAMAEYQKFNEELVKAGVVLEAGRLYPSVYGDQGARGRVLAVAGPLDRRGPRMAEAGALRRRDVRDP